MAGARRRAVAALRDGRGRQGPALLRQVGSRPNRFVGFDPATEEFFTETAIASGGGTVRHMFFHAPTREISFGTDTNNIGRARVP